VALGQRILVGQGYVRHGITAIMNASEQKKRVLVVGIYVSSSALRIHQRAVAGTRRSVPDVTQLVEEERVVFSEQGVVSHPATVRWVLETANHALGAGDPKSATSERVTER